MCKLNQIILLFTLTLDYPPYVAIVGGVVQLPCNITSPSDEDNVVLVLWYRDDVSTPLYSIDSRSTSLTNAKHFPGDILGERGYFNVTYPIAYLVINPIREDDGGEYRCRVDFRKARTVNRIMKLNVIVPVQHIAVVDDYGNRVKDIAGAYNEDSKVNLTCEAEGGNPSPSVHWYSGAAMIDDTYYITPKGITVNTLSLPPLKREDLMMVLSCKASNNNVTSPVSYTIAIDMNLKPREVKIITPMNKLSSGTAVEFVCQSTGSKPPANIKWSIGKKLLDNLGESVSEDGSVTTSFLSYVPSIEDNGKRLSCIAENPKYPGIKVDDGFVVQIKYSPLVSLVMGASVQREQIFEGSDILFECNVQANPPFSSLGWTFNEQHLTAAQHASNVFISNTSLLLKSVWKQNSGSYRCWAVNDEGRGESDAINLNIQYAPYCKSQRQILGVTTHEEATVHCEVDALPADVTFYWVFNNSRNEVLDVATFSSTGVRSTATYTPRSIADFGLLNCVAENSVGKQREPCQYYIVPAAPPEPPNNCTVNNVTIHSLSVECEPGYSGGLQQTFHLEIYTKKNRLLLSNQTSSDYPFFTTHSLPAGHSFTIVVYASNSKGRSESLTIKGSTLLASQLFSDESEEIVISPILATLMSSVCLLVILAVIIILVMKIKNEEHMRDLEKVRRKRGSASNQMINNKLATNVDVHESRYLNQISVGSGHYVPDIQTETVFECNENDAESVNDAEEQRHRIVTDAQIIAMPPQQYYDLSISSHHAQHPIDSPIFSEYNTQSQMKSAPIFEDIEDLEEICKANEMLVDDIYRCEQQAYSHHSHSHEKNYQNDT